MPSAELASLPEEVLARIFGFLDDKTQHCFIRVSRALNLLKVTALYNLSLQDTAWFNSKPNFAILVHEH